MKAMVLAALGEPLKQVDLPDPAPGPGQVLVRVTACGVCRTDLHVVDGDLPEPCLPIIPGHEIVGIVTALGDGVDRFSAGDRVGIPWLGSTCGTCRYCRGGQENLCDDPRFTGYQIHGGYAELAVSNVARRDRERGSAAKTVGQGSLLENPAGPEPVRSAALRSVEHAVLEGQEGLIDAPQIR